MFRDKIEQMKNRYEIKAIEAANKSIAAEGTISHEEIDWN